MIFHVDMDAFFAAVEVRDQPMLRGKPVLVGGAGRRGVVAAASYEARRYGCRSAMPTAVALRRCPHAIVLPPRFEAYSEASAQVFEIFARYSPCVEPLSIDEAFLDMAGTERLLGTSEHAAECLRGEVQKETGGLTCSVGISAVKFIAKIASGARKPDGLTMVPAGQERAFLAPLPLESLWGIGPKTAARLRERGLKTVGDLAELSAELLQEWFGEHGSQLHRLAHARDPRPVDPHRMRKSIGHEDTFVDDLRGFDQIASHLLLQATRVADRLCFKRLQARRVQLKIRDTHFRTETRQCMLPHPTAATTEIYRAARELLRDVELEGRSFRLTGVSVSSLTEASPGDPQLELFADAPRVDPGHQARENLQTVVSAVRQRFGSQALFPADAGSRDTPREGTGAVSKTRDDRPSLSPERPRAGEASPPVVERFDDDVVLDSAPRR